jgi:hypothetical protein
MGMSEAFRNGNAMERGVANAADAAKTVIKTPANVDWKKNGIVGGIAQSTGDAALNVVGQTVKLASLGAGYVLGKARQMAYGTIKGTAALGVGLAKNIPLPMPGGGTSNAGKLMTTYNPSNLNSMMAQGRLDELWKKPDSPPASSPGPDAAKT